MSMIRIDDDTFIDDSLITCAEYQLFIDEMRAQGKYHQPDHWTEYHFPKGQARKPILGVRPKDAEAFCEWLTDHQKDGWRYRVPVSNEVKEYLLQVLYPTPAGYWLVDYTHRTSFAWSQGVSQYPRNLVNLFSGFTESPVTFTGDFVDDFTQALKRSNAGNPPNGLDNSFASSLSRAFVNMRYLDRALDLDHVQSIDLSRIVDRENDLELSRSIDIALSRDINQDQDNDTKPFIDQARVNTIIRAIDIPIAFSRDRDLPIDIIFNHVLDFALARIPDNNQAPELVRELDYIFDIYIDLYTLRERIAGRSPAFEGIRIVKERIK